MLKELREGLFYTALGKYSTFLVQLIITGVLSRLLTPYDFGLVATVQIFIVFLQLIIESGLGPSIIQNKTLNRQDYSNLFWFSVIISFFVALFLVIIGPIIAKIYHNEIYISLCLLQSITVFFAGLVQVPTAILNKNKQFKTLNIAQFFTVSLSGIIGVSLALNNFGVYALIINSLVVNIISFFILYKLSQLTIICSFNLSSIKKVIPFAKNQFLFNLINYFSRNGDNILISRQLGSNALAFYNKSYQLLLLPNTLLLSVINPVLQPILSQFEKDNNYIKDFYFKMIDILLLIGMPLSVLLSLNSSIIIKILFGQNWKESILPFSILSLSVWCNLILSTTGAIYQSCNKTQYLLRNGILSTFLLVSFMFVGILFNDLVIFSVFLTIGFTLNFFLSFYLLTKYVLYDDILLFIRKLILPFILSLVLLCFTLIIKLFLPNEFFILCSSLIIYMVLVIIFGYLFYKRFITYFISSRY